MASVISSGLIINSWFGLKLADRNVNSDSKSLISLIGEC
jgi:hypothetical protein